MCVREDVVVIFLCGDDVVMIEDGIQSHTTDEEQHDIRSSISRFDRSFSLVFHFFSGSYKSTNKAQREREREREREKQIY